MTPSNEYEEIINNSSETMAKAVMRLITEYKFTTDQAIAIVTAANERTKVTEIVDCLLDYLDENNGAIVIQKR